MDHRELKREGLKRESKETGYQRYTQVYSNSGNVY